MFYQKFKAQLVEYLKDDWIFIQRNKLRKQGPFEPRSLILLQFSLENNPSKRKHIYNLLTDYIYRFRTSDRVLYFPSGYTWTWPETPYHYPEATIIYKDFLNIKPNTVYFAILSTSNLAGSLRDLEDLKKHLLLGSFLLTYKVIPIDYPEEGPIDYAQFPAFRTIADLVMFTQFSYFTLFRKTWSTFFGITSITGYFKMPVYWIAINILSFFVTCINIIKRKPKSKTKSEKKNDA